MMRSSESVHRELDREIAALAERYKLTEEAVNALQRLVRLVDWEAPNFVRKTSSRGGGRSRKRRDAASITRVASNLLSESLAGLELGPMRTVRRMADIGSGAGFPGLVLAAALQQVRMTLIEKRPNKCSFLRRAVSELSLANVEVVEGNVLDWSEGLASCDIVTSRKVGRPGKMLELSAPLLAQEGWVALWPGTSPFEEEVPKTGAGLRVVQIIPLEWENRAGGSVTRHIYLYEKVGENWPGRLASLARPKRQAHLVRRVLHPRRWMAGNSSR
jgi:16S rRNA (guanine(527)-N(7))-methyltransferase RsmG